MTTTGPNVTATRTAGLSPAAIVALDAAGGQPWLLQLARMRRSPARPAAVADRLGDERPGVLGLFHRDPAYAEETLAQAGLFGTSARGLLALGDICVTDAEYDVLLSCDADDQVAFLLVRAALSSYAGLAALGPARAISTWADAVAQIAWLSLDDRELAGAAGKAAALCASGPSAVAVFTTLAADWYGTLDELLDAASRACPAPSDGG